MASSTMAALAPSPSLPVHLVRGCAPDGRACWFFVQTPPYKMNMLNARPDAVRRIEDYGQIVARGWGHTPDAATLETMHKQFGFVPSNT